MEDCTLISNFPSALMTVKGGDVEQLLSTSYGQPYVQVFYNVTQSAFGATAMTALTFTLLLFGVVNQVFATWYWSVDII